MSQTIVYSSDSGSDSDVEQIVYVKKSRKKIVEPTESPPVKGRRSRVVETNVEPVETNVEPVPEPVKKPRKARAPLSEDQKQVLRDRLAAAREAKSIKRGVPKAEPVVEAIVSKPKRVSKKSVAIAETETPKRASKKSEPETPPAKPKRVYKKKPPPVNPF